MQQSSNSQQLKRKNILVKEKLLFKKNDFQYWDEINHLKKVRKTLEFFLMEAVPSF